jgi:hypothetical protein
LKEAFLTLIFQLLTASNKILKSRSTFAIAFTVFPAFTHIQDEVFLPSLPSGKPGDALSSCTKQKVPGRTLKGYFPIALTGIQ